MESWLMFLSLFLAGSPIWHRVCFRCWTFWVSWTSWLESCLMPMIRWRLETQHWRWEQRPYWRTFSRGLDKVFRSASPCRVPIWTYASLMFVALVLLWWRLSRLCLRAEDPWSSEPPSSFLSRPGQSIADLRHTPLCSALKNACMN